MVQKYSSPNEIPDDVIRDAFKNAEAVRYQARNFNYIAHGFIGFGDLGWWLPLGRVLALLGITTTMLRPVFNPQHKMVKRRFPMNWSWFGLNDNRYKVIDIELPEKIETYKDLGSFPLNTETFLKLAKVLGKPVEVYRVDSGPYTHDHLFTAFPSGEIVKPKIAAVDE